MVRREPSSIKEAYGILNGITNGDPNEAQSFLDSMDPEEVRARGRSEARSEVKLKKRRRPLGSGPYPYLSRQYGES